MSSRWNPEEAVRKLWSTCEEYNELVERGDFWIAKRVLKQVEGQFKDIQIRLEDRFARRANKRFGWIDPLFEQEALEQMNHQLFLDLFDPTTKNKHYGENEKFNQAVDWMMKDVCRQVGRSIRRWQTGEREERAKPRDDDDPKRMIDRIFLEEIFCQLSERAKEVLDLRIYQDLKWVDVADELNVPEKTSRRRFEWALKELRKFARGRRRRG